jgi:predicted outer membrane protein
VFLGKGRCAECHIPQTSFLDNNMHDLKLERFYEPGKTVNGLVVLPDGPIKTFTLRGIKDSPPYLHDGRLLTLADTVEFFNVVLGLKLTRRRKRILSLTCWLYEPIAVLGRNSKGGWPMRSFPAALLLSAIAAPALAAPQNPAAPAPGNPAVTSPRGREMGPGAAGPAEVNNPDRSFARAAAAGGLAEVDFGRLAEKKASAQPVKEFGQLMIRDYGPANGRLANLAKAQVLSLPGALDREDQLLRGNLEKTSGAEDGAAPRI